MTSIHHYLTTAIQEAFKTQGLDLKWGSVKSADRPDLADYQCNGALGAAKQLGMNPKELGQRLVDELGLRFPLITFSIAGPGFINMHLTDGLLTQTAKSMLEDDRLQIPKAPPRTIIIDYGGPNAAKPMHVGHLRSSIIGEALKRLLRFMGHTVIGDIHLGDWGTQMGMLIYGLAQLHPEWVYFDPNFKGPYPENPPVTLKDLEDLYPKISALSKTDEHVAIQARQATFELQQGRPGYKALWHHFVAVSLQDMKQQFTKLNVDFDQWFGESRYESRLPSLVQELVDKGIAENSQGALIVPVAFPEDKYEIPPLMLQKSDGGYLYATTDLATIEERTILFKADEIIYVVDGRQGLHFEQVFRVAKKMGLPVKTHFLGFGTMNGPDNKPFKTRAGGVMRLEDLIETLEIEARKRLEEAGIAQNFTPQEKEDIAFKVSIAALKFADLQHDPKQNYQFDIEKFMSFEGKTGPYLLYAAVRIKSLLKKAEIQNLIPGPLQGPYTPDERILILTLINFPEVLNRAALNLGPNILCEYIFELAQKFSRFYQNCPVLSESQKEIQQSRLNLCVLTLKTVQVILDILGIPIPQQM